jgi:hypothetical protein
MGGRREPNEYDLIWLIKHGREWVENLQDRQDSPGCANTRGGRRPTVPTR